MNRCHMNPGCAFPAAFTQLFSLQTGAADRRLGVGPLCAGGRPACTLRYDGSGRAGHKIWSGIRSHPPQWECRGRAHSRTRDKTSALSE